MMQDKKDPEFERKINELMEANKHLWDAKYSQEDWHKNKKSITWKYKRAVSYED